MLKIFSKESSVDMVKLQVHITVISDNLVFRVFEYVKCTTVRGRPKNFFTVVIQPVSM